ncbi:hypothetical protein T484DRAFT_1801280 [Baffinella frigidus]|nr:hypothetical protein T484DRAFT_1801280 [Cryptophyta sp. CCMP2293]
MDPLVWEKAGLVGGLHNPLAMLATTASPATLAFLHAGLVGGLNNPLAMLATTASPATLAFLHVLVCLQLGICSM